MKFTLENYKFLKIKNYLRDNSILYIYNVKTKKKFIKDMQFYNKLNVNCYKISNSLMKLNLKDSTYTNYNCLVSGLINIIKINNNTDNNLLKLNSNGILLGIKLNNKLYLKKIYNNQSSLKFDYKKDSTNLLQILRKNLKKVKTFRNNVIRTHDYLFPKQVR